MELSTQADVLVLVNPKAQGGMLGAHWKKRYESELLAVLGPSLRVQVHFTSDQDFGSGIVARALRAGIKKLVIVGGDGTFSQAIHGFFENEKQISSDAVLSFVPAGRGNDFFKTLIRKSGLSGQSTWTQGLRILAEGMPQKFDLGLIRYSGLNRYFLNIASFGFPGLVVQRTHPQGKGVLRSWVNRSALTYGINGLLSLRDYQPLEVQVRVDEKDFFEGRVYSGFILNGLYNAGGLCWDKAADPQDGLFHLVLYKGCSRLRYLGNLTQVFLKMSDQLNGVLRVTAKKIDVTIVDQQKLRHPFFEVDGDLLSDPLVKSASFEAVPGCIQIQSIIK